MMTRHATASSRRRASASAAFAAALALAAAAPAAARGGVAVEFREEARPELGAVRRWADISATNEVDELRAILENV